MSCFGGNAAEQKAQRERSKQLDEKLRQIAVRRREEVRVLLLGSRDSGSSAIFHRLKYLAAEEYTGKGFIPLISSTCIDQIQALLYNMALSPVKFHNSSNIERADRISQLPSTPDSFCPSVAKDINELWKDEGIQKVYTQQNKGFLQVDSFAEYFLSHVERFSEEEYVPTLSDILLVPKKTNIEEAEFEIEDLQFRVLNVEGMPSEPRTWIHSFDCVTMVAFCASLSNYDQILREDDSQTSMKESLLLFDEVRNSVWFRHIPFILYLNNAELFSEKIKKVPLSVCFHDFPSDNANEIDCLEFIKKKYANASVESSSRLYTIVTSSTDYQGIVNALFSSTRDILLSNLVDTVFDRKTS